MTFYPFETNTVRLIVQLSKPDETKHIHKEETDMTDREWFEKYGYFDDQRMRCMTYRETFSLAKCRDVLNEKGLWRKTFIIDDNGKTEIRNDNCMPKHLMDRMHRNTEYIGELDIVADFYNVTSVSYSAPPPLTPQWSCSLYMHYYKPIPCSDSSAYNIGIDFQFGLFRKEPYPSNSLYRVFGTTPQEALRKAVNEIRCDTEFPNRATVNKWVLCYDRKHFDKFKPRKYAVAPKIDSMDITMGLTRYKWASEYYTVDKLPDWIIDILKAQFGYKEQTNEEHK